MEKDIVKTSTPVSLFAFQSASSTLTITPKGMVNLRRFHGLRLDGIEAGLKLPGVICMAKGFTSMDVCWTYDNEARETRKIYFAPSVDERVTTIRTVLLTWTAQQTLLGQFRKTTGRSSCLLLADPRAEHGVEPSTKLHGTNPARIQHEACMKTMLGSGDSG